MNPQLLIRLLGITLFLTLTACSHGARKVDCAGHLEAINPPHAIKAEAPKSP
jgi:hypothetical protein